MPAVDLFVIKRNDTDPVLEYDAIPSSLDFTGATAVFNMRDANTLAMKVTRASASAVMVDGKPRLRYFWSASDTDTAGNFEAEFEVTYASGRIGTFPNEKDKFIDVQVGEDLG